MAFKRTFSARGGSFKRRRTFKAKRFRGKFAKRRIAPRVPRNRVQMGLGFPKQITVSHKYVGSFQQSSALGAVGITRFSCNGMFDPDVSGVGHQPMYFDQYSAIYDHYVVIGSKIVVKMANIVTTSAPGRATIFVNDDTSVTGSTVEAISEQSLGKSPVMIPAGMNDKAIVMSAKWSAKKFFGGSTMANVELQGTSAANPTEQSYYDVVLQADAAGNLTMMVTVEITYIAVWKELKDVSQS